MEELLSHQVDSELASWHHLAPSNNGHPVLAQWITVKGSMVIGMKYMHKPSNMNSFIKVVLTGLLPKTQHDRKREQCLVPNMQGSHGYLVKSWLYWSRIPSGRIINLMWVCPFSSLGLSWAHSFKVYQIFDWLAWDSTWYCIRPRKWLYRKRDVEISTKTWEHKLYHLELASLRELWNILWKARLKCQPKGCTLVDEVPYSPK